MIKLFATDLDGTLLTDKDEAFDEHLKQELNKIVTKGFDIVLVSGRNMAEIKMENGLYDQDFFIIGLNGTYILDKDKRLLLSRPIPKEVVDDFSNEFSNLPFDYIGVEERISLLSKEKYAAAILKRVAKSDFVKYYLSIMKFDMKKEKLQTKNIYKIEYLCEKDVSAKIIEILKIKYNSCLDYCYDGTYLEIIPKNENKGTALQFLANYLNISNKEIAVFGDSANDKKMFEAFSNSYAVNNAQEDIKKLAKEIIGSNNDYGVVKKINELINTVIN